MKSLRTLALLPALVLASSAVLPAQQAADTHGLPPASQLKVKENERTVPFKMSMHDYDIRKLTSAPPLSAEATVGKALFQQRCAYCHDGMGQPTYHTMGSWIDSGTVEDMGADGLKQIIGSGVGRMPAFKYELDARQLDDVIEFLKTVPASLRPTPMQLSGRLAGSGSNAE